MSAGDRRVAKARSADKRLQQKITNPVIDENDPTAILDEWVAGTIEVHEALEPHKPGRPRSAYQPTEMPRTRPEGAKWIEAEVHRRAAGYKRVSKQKRLLLLPAIVEEANRMLPDLAVPFSVDEFMPPPQHRVSSRPRPPRS